MFAQLKCMEMENWVIPALSNQNAGQVSYIFYYTVYGEEEEGMRILAEICSSTLLA